MVELAVRLLTAGGLVFIAGMAGWENFGAVWKTAAFVCGYAALGYTLKLTKRHNPGVAGILACFDAAAIAALLASTGSVDTFGFLVLAPVAFAAARYGSLPSAMAPIAAFELLGAEQWTNHGLPPSSSSMGHALGVLVVGLLLNHRRIVVTVAKPVLPETVEPLKEEEPEAYMELRESFRKLKDMYAALERKSRRDRYAADLRAAASGEGERFFKRLAIQLKKLSGADAVALYTLSEQGQSVVIRAFDGRIADSVQAAALTVRIGEASGVIRNDTENAIRALIDPEDRPYLRNIVLTHRGRVVGLIAAQAESGERLDSAAEVLEDLATLTSELIQEENRKQTFESRVHRAEVLYAIASVEAGAVSRHSLADRVVRELAAMLDVEHISLSWIVDGELLHASTQGPRLEPLTAMSFAEGPGVDGWLAVGAPEIVAYDVSEDARCRRAEMSRQRIQSFALTPVGIWPNTEAVLVAASPRSGAVDSRTAESLRMVGAELSQALQRLANQVAAPAGLMPPGEFYARLSAESRGCFVVLEPLRKEEMTARHGRPAFDLALRQLAHRLRARLPEGAALTRRNEDDYLVYLPDYSDSDARSWANEAAATASLIGIPVDDQGKRIPLAIRARVARLDLPAEPQTSIEAA